MNHTNLVGEWCKTDKISIISAKRWLAVEKGCNFASFTDYIYFKKRHSVVFFIFYIKRYVEITII